MATRKTFEKNIGKGLAKKGTVKGYSYIEQEEKSKDGGKGKEDNPEPSTFRLNTVLLFPNWDIIRPADLTGYCSAFTAYILTRPALAVTAKLLE